MGPPLSNAELQTRTRVYAGRNIPRFNPSINPLDLAPQATLGGITNAANPSYAFRFPDRGVENSMNWGDAPKDAFRGPGINNLDTSLFKNCRLSGERLRGQLRVEAYNVFNHTNFSSVDTRARFNAPDIRPIRCWALTPARCFRGACS